MSEIRPPFLVCSNSVSTVLRSTRCSSQNHPAHGSHRGRRVPAGDVADLLDGVAERGLLRTVDVVHSGYLGATDTGPVVLDTVDAVKRAAPMTPYCLDPVMGDNGTLYVEPDLVTFFRTKALPTADLVLPNLFEAECLLERPLSGVDDAVAAARALQTKVRRALSLPASKPHRA